MNLHRGSRNGTERGGAIASLIAILFVVALCAILYFARRPLLRFAAESWIVDEPAQHADALLLLGNDNFYADRATRAAELIRQGVAPVVVASGRRLRPSASITDLEVHDLIERGVPKEKILPFPHDAEGTLDEAALLVPYAQAHHFQSVIIVTSNYHSRRTAYIFRKCFPGAVSVSVASARDAEFDPQHWWEHRKSQELFLHELVGLPVAAWDLRGH